MNQLKVLLLSALLVSLCVGQTTTTCSSNLLPLLTTGAITLNPQDIDTSSSNKIYYRDLSSANFAQVDHLGYAFAIAGFTAACSQSIYTLSVDIVEFQNQNTRMKVTINFRSINGTYLTKWTSVSLTYLIVSRNFNGAYSNIWATVAEIAVGSLSISNMPIDSIGVNYDDTATFNTNDCRIFVDPNVVLDSSQDQSGCGYPAAQVTSATDGGIKILHAYIMGYSYQQSLNTSFWIAAGVFKGDNLTFPTSDSQGWAITYNNGPGNPDGPTVSINNYNGALVYLKASFVLSRMDFADATYPLGSQLSYTSSAIFTAVSTFNKAVPLIQGATGNNSAYNWHYFRIPSIQYSIYGLSSFAIPATGTCASISINSSLTSPSAYIVSTSNTNPNTVFFSADIFAQNIKTLCQSNDSTIPTFVDQGTVGMISLFTVPTQSNQQYIVVDQNAFNQYSVNTEPVSLSFVAMPNSGNTDLVTYSINIPFINLPLGPTKFQFKFFEAQPGFFNPNQVFKQQVMVNGQTVYYNVYKTVPECDQTDANGNLVSGCSTLFNIPLNVYKGINLNTTVANVTILVSFLRNSINITQVNGSIGITSYISAYDPVSGCCVSNCPANTGLDVSSSPPTCVYCNTQAGLFYNPANGTCTCLSGYYLDSSSTFQCYPCSALYCAVCSATAPAVCTTCQVGGILNNQTWTCSVAPGYYIKGSNIVQCPYACQTCTSPNGACATCVDPTHRDLTKGCNCMVGYFDSGSANCTACSQTCLTCTNATLCATCDSSKFRNLSSSNLCTCMNGYYELYYANLTRQCLKCSPECLTCSVSPSQCITCDGTKNRFTGVDSYGHQTCLCNAGFYATPDGSCIQSDCNADPFCSQCEQGLKQCIQCLSSKLRVIHFPDNRCVCFDGYYADPTTTNCLPCPAGCGICTSSVACTSCVALATPNGNGSCACPAQTFYSLSVDGVRYCQNCGSYCQICINATTCTTCLPSYVKTADNQCICQPNNYVNTNGSCVPCGTGCQTCASLSNCTQCISPLVLQGTVCQTSCNSGFTLSGSVCVTCPTGCLQCTANLICYYCANGMYAYKGNCFAICPAGTIGDNSTSNWACSPCNDPCSTCINHPSFCTSCEEGQGYLQTSAVQQSCVLSCTDGTFASNGVCQVCDFRCATCLGSATNCIACPNGQLLYQGSCWQTCPAILLAGGSGSGGQCVSTCPDGFYNVSTSTCYPCAPQCTTCSNSATNCTACLTGSIGSSGSCVTACGANQFSFRGFCVSCDKSCNGCQLTPTSCISCAAGYVLSGSLCQKSCLANQFYDTTALKCSNCDASCASCSASTYCTSCVNSQVTPIGGTCSKCIYPCGTCNANGGCTGCLSGFYFFNNQCQSSCPSGAYPSGGSCVCSSGIVANGQCVASCQTGFANVNGGCQPCNQNCVTCSGSVNACISCLSGFTLDSSSSSCVSVNQCPYGTDLQNGQCSRICDPNFYFYQGICIYGSCLPGFADNGNGGCLRSTSSASASSNSSAVSSASCPTGLYLLNGNCVGNCGSGYWPNSNSNFCVACASNCVSCFSATFCINCQSGFTSNAGVCTATSSCPSNQLAYGTSCVAACPIGTYSLNGKCQRSCPDNTYYQSLVCYSNCPTSLRTNEACVSTCPSGTTSQGGVCA